MSGNLSKLNVLIVDDNEPMRFLIKGALETLGVGQILTAENAKMGFNIFCKENPDICLIDWNMEPIDGLKLVKQIRTNIASPNRMVPLIMITGYSARERVLKARDFGVNDFMVKPFSVEDLAKRLAHIINRPRDFVEASSFFGPCRRRKTDPYFDGPYRRSEDQNLKSAYEISMPHLNQEQQSHY